MIRAWWAHRQGLDGSLSDAGPAEVLARSGWARSLGGASPYLALHARAGTSRAAADEAVARREIHELPAARGCTYVVPEADFALALSAAAGSSATELRTAEKLGVTEAEISALEAAVLRALEGGEMGPDAIRDVTGGAWRSLGEEGRKRGLGTTLPVALGRLQRAGRIRRVPTDGRLDQQRYRYALWSPGPLEGRAIEPEQVARELADRFFRWAGPATLDEFRTFAGLGVRAARAAVATLDLALLEHDPERLIHPDDLPTLAAFRMPDEPRYVLLGSVDSVLLLRRPLRALLEPADLEQPIWGERGPVSVGTASDLPHHAILDRGRLVGVWEYDPEAERIAWHAWVPRGPALESAVAETERWIREELGDARSFSLDSPRSRAPRLAALRAGFTA